MVTGKDIVNLALVMDGADYVWDSKPDFSDPNPSEADCSGLIHWVCGRLGVKPSMPDGSWNQYEFCRNHGTLIDIYDALRTPGALGFIQTEDEHHVVIFQGKKDEDGNWLTMQCKGRDYG